MPKKKYAVSVTVVVEANSKTTAMRKFLRYGIVAPHPSIKELDKIDFSGPVLELNEKAPGRDQEPY